MQESRPSSVSGGSARSHPRRETLHAHGARSNRRKDAPGPRLEDGGPGGNGANVYPVSANLISTSSRSRSLTRNSSAGRKWNASAMNLSGTCSSRVLKVATVSL